MPRPSTYFILYAGVLLMSVNGLFAKEIPLDATTITHLRSLIAAGAMVVFLLMFKRSMMIDNKKTLAGVYFIGVLMGLHWVTFFHAMQVSTVAIGMLSLFAFPAITVIMEAAIHKKRPSFKDLLLALIVLMGIVIMVADKPLGVNSLAVQGALWGLLSALFFSSRNILQKYCFVGVSSDKLMLHQMLAVMLLLLFFIDVDSISTLNSSEWLAIVILGILTTAGAHTLIVISYKRLPAKTVAMISCLQPVLAAILAWFFLKEELSVYIAVGGGLILLVALYESLSMNTK